mgnify:CR=1 FL=1
MKSQAKNSRRYLPLILLGILVVCIILIFTIGRANKKDAPTDFKEYYQQEYANIAISGSANYMVFDSRLLMQQAHTIAIVTPLDALTTENSYGISSSGDLYYNAHSIRKVQVIQVFKNEKNYDDTIEIAEKCVLLEDGTLVMDEYCYPMQVGNYYLVFLTNSGLGYPLTLSADNGKFIMVPGIQTTDLKKIVNMV